MIAASHRGLLLRHRRRALFVLAALLAPYAALDVASPHTAVSLSARSVWVATLFAVAALQREHRARLADALAPVAAAVSGLACTAIVAVHGGATGVYFGMLIAGPFAVGIVFPDLPSTSALTGAITAAGGVAILLHEGRGARAAAEWGLFASAATCLAAWAHALYQGAWRSAQRAQRERTLALEELAASERRRGDAERLALVGRLAAGVAHEVNNPLAFVKANAEWLRGELDRGTLDGDEAREVLAATAAGAERIARIVEDLRVFARPGEPQGGACPVDEVIRDALRLASLRLKCVDVVTVDVAPGLPRADADARKLAQAVVNLLVNAADAVESSSTRARGAAGVVRVAAQADGEHVVISVEDSGDGLAQDAAAHLFEPFFTTKGARGTGLGLAVSRENLAGFGATLQAGPSALGGARFTIRLRRATPPRASNE